MRARVLGAALPIEGLHACRARGRASSYEWQKFERPSLKVSNTPMQTHVRTFIRTQIYMRQRGGDTGYIHIPIAMRVMGKAMLIKQREEKR